MKLAHTREAGHGIPCTLGIHIADGRSLPTFLQLILAVWGGGPEWVFHGFSLLRMRFQDYLVCGGPKDNRHRMPKIDVFSFSHLRCLAWVKQRRHWRFFPKISYSTTDSSKIVPVIPSHYKTPRMSKRSQTHKYFKKKGTQSSFPFKDGAWFPVEKSKTTGGWDRCGAARGGYRCGMRFVGFGMRPLAEKQLTN